MHLWSLGQEQLKATRKNIHPCMIMMKNYLYILLVFISINYTSPPPFLPRQQSQVIWSDLMAYCPAIALLCLNTSNLLNVITDHSTQVDQIKILNVVSSKPPVNQSLTHWGRVTHICVGNLTIIGSDNGLLPGRRQAITWTNVGILLIGPLGTNFSEMLIEIHKFSFKKIHLKMSSGKWRPFCLGLNVLNMAGRICECTDSIQGIYQWLSARLQYLHC